MNSYAALNKGSYRNAAKKVSGSSKCAPPYPACEKYTTSSSRSPGARGKTFTKKLTRNSRNLTKYNTSEIEGSRQHARDSAARHPWKCCSRVDDIRPLPLPTPHLKRTKATTHVSTCKPYTWPKWRQWMQSCWSRNWEKRCINRVLKKRDVDSCNKGSTFQSNTFGRAGAIYALFHFPTGRWYVGQTIHPVHVRAQQHWW